MLSVIKLSVTMLSVVTLSAIMLSVVMLIVVTPKMHSALKMFVKSFANPHPVACTINTIQS